MSVYAASRDAVITADGGVALPNAVSRCRQRHKMSDPLATMTVIADGDVTTPFG